MQNFLVCDLGTWDAVVKAEREDYKTYFSSFDWCRPFFQQYIYWFYKDNSRKKYFMRWFELERVKFSPLRGAKDNSCLASHSWCKPAVRVFHSMQTEHSKGMHSSYIPSTFLVVVLAANIESYRAYGHSFDNSNETMMQECPTRVNDDGDHSDHDHCGDVTKMRQRQRGFWLAWSTNKLFSGAYPSFSISHWSLFSTGEIVNKACSHDRTASWLP